MVSFYGGLCLAAEHRLDVYPAVGFLLAAGKAQAAPWSDGIRRRAFGVGGDAHVHAGKPHRIRCVDADWFVYAVDDVYHVSYTIGILHRCAAEFIDFHVFVFVFIYCFSVAFQLILLRCCAVWSKYRGRKDTNFYIIT